MIYYFSEGLEWDEDLFELRCRGESMPVPVKALKLIDHLIRNRLRTVKKNELIAAVWGDYPASDACLSQMILRARSALADDGERQRVIKTVRGYGFRFVAPVRVSEPVQDPGSELWARTGTGV
jgi:DNA-binding winged helix-turn-helix (wHTH) protein